MVHPEGVEPPTPGSEDQCSIQLSYECMCRPSVGKSYSEIKGLFI